MTFDLFAEPEPDEAAPATAPEPATAPSPDWSPARADFEARRAINLTEPCLLPYRPDTGQPYRCQFGDGSGSFSADGGRSHFCMKHRPWGFLPSERDGGWLTQRGY